MSLRAIQQRFLTCGRRLLLLLGLPVVAFGSSASLNEEAEAKLIEFAIGEVGISVWHVFSAVPTSAYPPLAAATVVFEPTDVADTCWARAIHLSARADEDGVFDWASSTERGTGYRLWLSPCESADINKPVYLRRLIGFDVLEQIRDETDAILEQASVILARERENTDPRLSEIDLRYDPNHGPVYTIGYETQFCIWVHADVVFESGRARVLDARLAMC